MIRCPPRASVEVLDRLMTVMDPAIRAGLSGEQEFEVRRVLAAAVRAPRRNVIDIRLALNLVVTRIFLVFIVGKDRRVRSRLTPLERRRAQRQLSTIVFLVTASLVVFFVVLGMIYVGKTQLGIDVFPDFHMRDLVSGRW